MRYYLEGWPSHPPLPSSLRPYWQVQSELTLQHGLLLKGVRLVTPDVDAVDYVRQATRGPSSVARGPSHLSGGPDSADSLRSLPRTVLRVRWSVATQSSR